MFTRTNSTVGGAAVSLDKKNDQESEYDKESKIRKAMVREIADNMREIRAGVEQLNQVIDAVSDLNSRTQKSLLNLTQAISHNV